MRRAGDIPTPLDTTTRVRARGTPDTLSGGGGGHELRESPTALEAMVLTAMLERPTLGPIHLAQRMNVRRIRRVCTCFNVLRSHGMILAPADTGAEHWTVTRTGRDYLGAQHSTLVSALLRSETP